MTAARKLTKKPAVPAQASAATAEKTQTIAHVPDRQYALSYVSRDINGVRDLDVLRRARAHALNVLLDGPTQSGKTSLTLAFAATEGLPFYSISSNAGVDSSQMIGSYVVNPDTGKLVWRNGGLTEIMSNGGVLLINEVNFLPERVASVLFQPLDKRREVTLMEHNRETIRAHQPPFPEYGNTKPCWCPDGMHCPQSRAVLIVADMNDGYAGTRALNHAFRARFAIQIQWGYHPEVEAQLVPSKVLLGLARKMREDRTIDTPIGTGMLAEFCRIVDLFGLDFAIENFVEHFYEEERQGVRDAFKGRHAALRKEFFPEEAAVDQFSDIFDLSNWGWILSETTPSTPRWPSAASFQ